MVGSKLFKTWFLKKKVKSILSPNERIVLKYKHYHQNSIVRKGLNDLLRLSRNQFLLKNKLYKIGLKE